MPIFGLTDRITFRRDGKIRAGTRDEDSGKMDNTPHFLLHDAPQLIPVLGENPKEIYFTAYTDNPTEFFRDDLRWYTRSELVCVGDGRMAAYKAFGDVPGVKQNPHPRDPKARERACLYKSCQQYLEGKCGEHFFLDMVVPQYSMGSVFTLDNTSIFAVINISSALQKAALATGGKLAGQIFKLYKKIVPVSYTDVAKAKKFNRDQAVIHMDYVPFEYIPKEVREKISADNWAALMGLKNGTTRINVSLPSPDQAAQLEAPEEHKALPSPDEQDAEDKALKERANNPTVVKFVEELAALTGVPNSEENRIKLARNVTPPTAEGIVNYVKGRIQKLKKEKESEPPKAPLASTPPETVAANTTLF
jgi:recombination directionality factor gp3-like protein